MASVQDEALPERTRSRRKADASSVREVARASKMSPLSFGDAVREAERGTVRDRRYLEALGFPERAPCRVQDLWQHLIEVLTPHRLSTDWARFYALYVAKGTLARRIANALSAAPPRRALEEVYRGLCDGLAAGTLFDG